MHPKSYVLSVVHFFAPFETVFFAKRACRQVAYFTTMRQSKKAQAPCKR